MVEVGGVEWSGVEWGGVGWSGMEEGGGRVFLDALIRQEINGLWWIATGDSSVPCPLC